MTDPRDRPYDLDRIVRTLFVVGVVAALVWLVDRVAEVLIPLVMGILLAYLLDPVVHWVEGYIKHRVAAVLLTIVVLITAGIGSVVAIAPVISAEFESGIRLARESVKRDSPVHKRLKERLPAEMIEVVKGVLGDEKLQAFLRQNTEFRTFAVSAAKRVVPQLWSLLSGAMSVVGVVVQLFLVLVYLVFISIDFRTFKTTWPNYLPPHYRDDIMAFLDEFNDALSRYFRGQFMVAAAVGVLFSIGFGVIGLKMGILLGLFLGALNMVPYLQIVGVVPAVLMAGLTAAEQGSSFPALLVGVLVVFIVAQVAQDVLITPRIMGQATGLSPVVILFSVLFWGNLLGFLGLMLAIPLTCLALAYYRRMIASQSPQTA